MAIAGDRLAGRTVGALERFRYGPGVFKVDWALDGPIPWSRRRTARRAGTVHLGGTLAEIVAVGGRRSAAGRHPDRPFVLLAQQTLFDPSRAPAGKHTAWAYCHVPNGSTVDMTGQIEAQVERFAPGFRDLVLARATHTAGRDGGIRRELRRRRHQRRLSRTCASCCSARSPRSIRTTLGDGLYLCSSSTPPGGGVHGMCGWHAARSALRREFGRRV